MSRAPVKVRQEAKRLFITTQMTNAQIAQQLRVKPHTVGRWRKLEDWDTQKIQIERQVAERMNRRMASERTELNLKHFKFWEILMARVADALAKPDFEQVKILTRLAGIVDRAQKGQRLARGLNSDGQTEELIRAQAQAENRTLANLLLDIVKDNIPDEETRSRIADAIAEAVSDKQGPEAEDLKGPAAR